MENSFFGYFIVFNLVFIFILIVTNFVLIFHHIKMMKKLLKLSEINVLQSNKQTLGLIESVITHMNRSEIIFGQVKKDFEKAKVEVLAKLGKRNSL